MSDENGLIHSIFKTEFSCKRFESLYILRERRTIAQKLVVSNLYKHSRFSTNAKSLKYNIMWESKRRDSLSLNTCQSDDVPPDRYLMGVSGLQRLHFQLGEWIDWRYGQNVGFQRMEWIHTYYSMYCIWSWRDCISETGLTLRLRTKEVP